MDSGMGFRHCWRRRIRDRTVMRLDVPLDVPRDVPLDVPLGVLLDVPGGRAALMRPPSEFRSPLRNSARRSCRHLLGEPLGVVDFVTKTPRLDPTSGWPPGRTNKECGSAAPLIGFVPAIDEVSATGHQVVVPLAVVVASILLSVGCIRFYRRLVRHSSVGYAVVPSSDFDPSPEEVLRFAAGLLQARPVTRLFRPLRQQMVRIAFVSDDEGNLVHLLAASSHARSVVERNGFAAVDLEDATATIGRPIPWLPASVDEPSAPSDRHPPTADPATDAASGVVSVADSVPSSKSWPIMADAR